jgi:hypothetical protein
MTASFSPDALGLSGLHQRTMGSAIGVLRHCRFLRFNRRGLP